MRMENINTLHLLQSYIQTKYPKQKDHEAVLAIMLDEIEFDCEREALLEHLAICGLLPPPQFMNPGILIIEMNDAQAHHLINLFNKSGFRMLMYRNGECINENR